MAGRPPSADMKVQIGSKVNHSEHNVPEPQPKTKTHHGDTETLRKSIGATSTAENAETAEKNGIPANLEFAIKNTISKHLVVRRGRKRN
jgi:hypothetical protein